MIYLFDKSQIADATYNLSTKFLHVYKVSVRRLGVILFSICSIEVNGLPVMPDLLRVLWTVVVDASAFLVLIFVIL